MQQSSAFLLHMLQLQQAPGVNDTADPGEHHNSSQLGSTATLTLTATVALTCQYMAHMDYNRFNGGLYVLLWAVASMGRTGATLSALLFSATSWGARGVWLCSTSIDAFPITMLTRTATISTQRMLPGLIHCLVSR